MDSPDMMKKTILRPMILNRIYDVPKTGLLKKKCS